MTRVVHVNASDTEGGAARAAYRLHLGLSKLGMDSMMYVQERRTSDHSVYGPASKYGKLVSQIRPYLDRIPSAFCKSTAARELSLAVFPGRAASRIRELNPDIVHLHWLNKGFIRLESLRRLKKRPMVWTLHDSWAFTGGCHVPYACLRYRGRCGLCPKLNSRIEHDISRWIWSRKRRAYSGLDLTVVTPSRWLGDCARKSSLLKNARVEVIPNGIDTDLYRPIDKKVCRELFSLPNNKKIVMFGALYCTSDANKGFDFLASALRKVAATSYKNDVIAVVLGADNPGEGLDIGLDTRFLGRLTDDTSLVLAYSAADVFVAPSRQENLPNMVMEAMSCGVPCVAFDIGGIPDLIEHGENGYLAQPYDVDDLAEGIVRGLRHNTAQPVYSRAARRKIELEFSDDVIARRHASLYEQLME